MHADSRLTIRIAVCSVLAVATACADTDDLDDGTGGAGGSGTRTTGAGTRNEDDTTVSTGDGGNNNCGTVEMCDGIDNTCDGEIDEGCDCAEGEMQPCFSGDSVFVNVGACIEGTQTCGADGKWGICEGEVLPSNEICDAVDNNCDGNVNEGTCNLPNSVSSCSGGSCSITGCNAGFSNCDANATNGCETSNAGWSNASPGEYLGTWEADSVYGFGCLSGGNCEGPIVTRTGTQGAYFNIDADEASTCSAYVSLRFELLVPAGVDYDLYVGGTGCMADPGWQSLNGTGQTETIVIWCDDVSAADNSFHVDVEVRHYSGSSCQPWTLNINRRQC